MDSPGDLHALIPVGLRGGLEGLSEPLVHLLARLPLGHDARKVRNVTDEATTLVPEGDVEGLLASPP
jgi:hypothetical protein